MIKKKIGAFLMAIILVGSIIGPITPTNAAEIVDQGMCGENIIWTLYDDGLLEVTGIGQIYDYHNYVIDSTEHSPWYENKDIINKVVISEGITRIGEFAFEGLSNVKEYNLPDSLRCIGFAGIRANTSLEIIELPAGLEEIEEYAFCESGLLEIVIPKKITHIAERMLYGSERIEKVVVLSEKIDSVDESAFAYCNKLKEVDFAGVVEYVGLTAFQYCTSLKSFGNMTEMKKIGPRAFYHCNLNDFSMFKGIEEIEGGAFLYAFSPEVKEIVIPSSVKRIGSQVFTGSYIWYAIVGETLEYIDKNAFGDIIGLILVTSNDVIIEDKGYTLAGSKKMECNVPVLEVRPVGEVTVTNNFSSIYWTVQVGEVEVPSGSSVSFNLENEPISIEVVEGSYDTEWYKGKKYDHTGLKIIAHYEDGSSVELDSGFIVSDVDVSEVGEKIIEVTYGSTTTSYAIDVIEIPEDEMVTIFKSVDVVVDENFTYKDVYFIPSASGKYVFYTTGQQDTKGTLMNSVGAVLATNDDSETVNYRIECNLDKDRLYIIRTELYLASNENPNISVVADLIKVTNECWVCDKQFVEEVSATCTQRGYRKYMCIYCKKQSTTYFSNPLGHDFSIVYEDCKATCTSDGYTIHMCTKCELKKIVSRENKTGHQYVDTVVAPTVKEYGYTLHSCQNCTYNYKTAWVEPIGTENELVYEENGQISSNDSESKLYSLEKSKIGKPKVKAKRVGKKVKLTLSSKENNVKYQIYVKKNKKYKRVKTTKKNRITFKCKKKSYIRVRIIKNTKNGKVYSKYTKVRI